MRITKLLFVLLIAATAWVGDSPAWAEDPDPGPCVPYPGLPCYDTPQAECVQQCEWNCSMFSGDYRLYCKAVCWDTIC